MRQRQKRTPALVGVDKFLKDRNGDRERCRKALKYIRRIGKEFDDLAALRALRDEFFEPGESAGALDSRIQELEREHRTEPNA